ncbi:MAG TPA: flagellar biosynthesis protein FlhB [Alphaproteobacteria bacterium]|jgi:flagellar biosynthetic protein FlhB|nr:flagellar biosynthesis protein FlhB [Alphaproteobacteria bacterium]
MSQSDQDPAQKTEDPTARKLEDAIKKGQVPRSTEVNNWFMIASGALVIGAFGPWLVGRVRTTLGVFLSSPHDMPFDPGQMMVLVRELGLAIFGVLSLPLLVFVVASLTANVIQHKPVLSAEKMKPDFSKMNPIKGLKQKFSLRTLAEFFKDLLKLVIVGSLALYLIWLDSRFLPQIMALDLVEVLQLVHSEALKLLLGVASVLAFIAMLDYAYQLFEHKKSLRMSRQEIKDEHKDSDGDPKIKARLRSIRQERARQRMLQAVPEATVVVTNPTHFAIALQYEHLVTEVPKVVAKGADNVALRIREVAEEHGVPIVENPPLARALHAVVEVDQDIPVEHYQAVAEIISYVLQLKNRMPRRRAAS